MVILGWVSTAACTGNSSEKRTVLPLSLSLYIHIYTEELLDDGVVEDGDLGVGQHGGLYRKRPLQVLLCVCDLFKKEKEKKKGTSRFLSLSLYIHK